MLNGLCESSHGMGDAGSFSLLALRSKTIAQSLDSTLSSDKTIDSMQAPLLAAI
jgi:L-ornithine N5-monooxygenase